jgi:hypothetical protein
MKRFGWIIVLALAVALWPMLAQAASVAPTVVPGNPSCEDLGYAYGFKPTPEATPSGVYNLGGGYWINVIQAGGTTPVEWASNIGIDAVIVKGGPNANVYVYDPESFGDSGLVAPDVSSGTAAGLSHLEFCYDFEVVVSKTAVTSFDRAWTWDIDKTSAVTQVTISAGQTFVISYTVDVSAVNTDTNFQVSGSIFITNPDPGNAAQITGVGDVITGFGAAPVTCPQSPPFSLASGATVVCTYNSGAQATNVFGNLNTATITTTGTVGGGSSTAAVAFGSPANETDECVDLTDSLAGALGTVCAPGPHLVSYSYQVGPYALCDTYQILNTATFTTTDSGATGTDVVTVPVNVVGCGGGGGSGDNGCTLTPGYWKTHSDRGPAPYDDNWANLGALEEDTIFFLSGQTWFQVFWTAPAGNVYYNLAHHYMAAKLNVLNGAAAPTAVLDAMADAEALFAAHAPAHIATLKGKAGNELRAEFITLAGILAGFNEGDTLIPHCDENETSNFSLGIREFNGALPVYMPALFTAVR